ncbi:MAG: hypothetical protein ACBZ72_12940 [Candidatus Bathyarchaeia archaeon]|jgi:hypothetical protein
MKNKVMLSALLLGLLVLMMSTFAFAVAPYSVHIKDPNNSANGALGVSSSGHWVGQIPIDVTLGAQTESTMSYCMHPDRTVDIGSTYSATATMAPDTATWRAISYILSWNTPSTDNAAATNQISIWKLLDPSYTPPSWMDLSIYSAGEAQATAATGKDGVRQGDVLNWISPIPTDGGSVQGNAGQTIVFTAQLEDSTGVPRPNVKMQFTVTLNNGASNTELNSTYVTPAEAFTDSQGRVQVAVTVPADTQLGSTIEVKASTQGVWVQKFLDLTSENNQDLIAVTPCFQLTTSTNICILGYITVVPESILGALSAVTAFAAAFVIYTKGKKQKIH